MSAPWSSSCGNGVTQSKHKRTSLSSYHSELVGNLIPDLIVEEKVIVDPKVVAEFNEAHIAQMIGYLTITGLELALLLNFKSARLESKRVVRQKRPATDAPDLHDYQSSSATSA